MSKLDWIWLCQDFNYFIQKEILQIKNKKSKRIETESKIETLTTLEGKKYLRNHLVKERDHNFIKLIKKKALKQNEYLNCEVCGFSFLRFYGELGYGFIEAHHKEEIGKRDSATLTREADISLICSNCHNMIHRSDPILTIEQLKIIISNTNK